MTGFQDIELNDRGCVTRAKADEAIALVKEYQRYKRQEEYKVVNKTLIINDDWRLEYYQTDHSLIWPFNPVEVLSLMHGCYSDGEYELRVVFCRIVGDVLQITCENRMTFGFPIE